MMLRLSLGLKKLGKLPGKLFLSTRYNVLEVIHSLKKLSIHS